MSNVWQTRCLVLVEQLGVLANRLRSKQPIASTSLEEHTARLLVGVLMLLRQHRVNKRGQCHYCRLDSHDMAIVAETATVHRVSRVGFHVSQPLAIVWMQLIGDYPSRRE